MVVFEATQTTEQRLPQDKLHSAYSWRPAEWSKRQATGATMQLCAAAPPLLGQTDQRVAATVGMQKKLK